MVTQIYRGNPSDFGSTAQVAAVPLTVKQLTTLKPQEDTVKLSTDAQIRVLKSQGQTVEEIALRMALTTKAVDSYLAITPAQAAPLASVKK